MSKKHESKGLAKDIMVQKLKEKMLWETIFEPNGPRQQANIITEVEDDEAEYPFVATYLGTSKNELILGCG